MTLTTDTLIIGLMLLLLATAVWLWARGLQQQTGLPGGDVIYTDSGTWFRNDKPLYANDVRLVGKPDYIIEQKDGTIIPVELKSSRAPDEPYDGHVLQLAAYCLLIEENYNIRPDYGIIQYKDKTFSIDYTEELEDDLLDLLEEMNDGLYADDVERDHNDWRKCAKCGVRNRCFQRLA